MAGLLVSVRSVEEARAALRGGAAVIDVKEPARGPLGMAPVATWRAVRAEVAGRVPLSVALGELAEYDPRSIPPEAFDGVDFRKVGPAGLGAGWLGRWDEARRADSLATGWVAVIYADWEAALAPHPDVVVAAAVRAPECRGLLVDSWDKSTRGPIRDLHSWRLRIELARSAGRFVALAGRLDRAEIRRLACLQPDLFAVRGAACVGQRRDGVVAAGLVAELVAAAGGS